MICNNSESHKMGQTKIPSEWLWCESLPVLGYVGVESAQSSSFYPQPPPPPNPPYTVIENRPGTGQL